MQSTSATWQALIASGNYTTETKINIAGTDYGEDAIVSMSISRDLFAGSAPSVGNCSAGEIDVQLLVSMSSIPRMAELKPYVRLKSGSTVTEWIQQGDFFTDTRKRDRETGAITLHGYDAMLKMEQPYCTSEEQSWPRTAVTVVKEVAQRIGVSIDNLSDVSAYAISNPGYGDGALTLREVMGYIAAAHAGNWAITPTGALRLVILNTLPAETSYLINGAGGCITVGGLKIVI